jgi:hypothetical protein
MDNNYNKKANGKDVNVKSIKCNNINVNVNGLELDVFPPFLGNGLAAEAQEGSSDASSFAGNSAGSEINDFRFICINNNNNTVVEEPIPSEPPTCEDCFEEFALTEELLTSIAGLEDPIIPLIAGGILDLTGVTDIESLCDAFLESSLILPPEVASQLFNQLLPGLTALEQIEVEELITCLFDTGTIIRGEF